MTNMRISTKQYAASLYGAVKDKNPGETKNVLANFLKILVKNNDLDRADKIIAEFVKAWNREYGLVAAEVVSARELDKDSSRAVKDYVKDLTGAREVELVKQVDGKLLAGFVLKFDDVVMDGSLKTKIGELRGEMKK